MRQSWSIFGFYFGVVRGKEESNSPRIFQRRKGKEEERTKGFRGSGRAKEGEWRGTWFKLRGRREGSIFVLNCFRQTMHCLSCFISSSLFSFAIIFLVLCD